MEDRHIFDSTVEGQRRSVLFALALTTAVIGVVAATSTFISPVENLGAVLALLAASLVFVAFAMSVYAGFFTGLVTDEQLLWTILEIED